MTQLTAKELDCITHTLTEEGLLCKKAWMYSRTLTDPDLSQCMADIAENHQQRYNALLNMIGGKA